MTSEPAGTRLKPKCAIVVFVGGILLVLLLLVTALLLGYLALGPKLTSGEVSSPYGILPGKSDPFSQVSLIPYYNASTTGATGFGTRFRLNVTSFVTGGFTSTNGIDIFIFPADSGGAFWSSLSKGLADAQGYTFTTGVARSGSFNISLPASTWELWVIDPLSQNSTLVVTQPFQAVSLCATGPVCHPELQNP